MAKSNTARIYIPITKIDVDTRTVYGRITDETKDAAGEVCDYLTSAPLFRAWSANVLAKTTAAGQEPSKGNVRVMHGLHVAGKLDELDCDDTTKAIDCAAKIVDDGEWEKCQTGCYTGFSLGGTLIGKKWKDPDTGGMRYTVDPVEVSLVDVPCNPSATFTMVKAGGASEDITFKVAPGLAPANADAEDEAPGPEALVERTPPTAEEVARVAGDLAKAAGKPETAFAEFIDAAIAKIAAEAPAPVAETDPPVVEEKVEAPEVNLAEVMALAQVWRTSDGKTFTAKQEASAHAADLVVQAKAATDPVARALAKAAGALEPTPEPKAEGAGLDFDRDRLNKLSAALTLIRTKYADTVVIKGLYSVSRLASLLESLGWLTSDVTWERNYEGDNSSIPEGLAAALSQLGNCLCDMAEEEVAELIASLQDAGVAVEIIDGDGIVEVIEMARAGVEVAKAGARNSKSDQSRLDAVHDHVVKLGAACDVAKAAKPEGVEQTGDVSEVEILRAEKAEMTRQLETVPGTIEKLVEGMAMLKADLEAFKSSPGPAAPRNALATSTRTITKGQDNAEVTEEGARGLLLRAVGELGQDEVARIVFKEAMSKPAGQLMPTV